MTRAEALVEGLAAEHVIGATAFDADAFRARLDAQGSTAVIPPHPSRARAPAYDRDKERHLVECFFSKLKQFRRIATRYEKTARNFLAMITIACAMVWLR